MSTRGQAHNETFEVIALTKLQLGKRALIYFPDPDNSFVSDYGPSWSWEIFNHTDSVVVQADTQDSATEDYVTVTLDPLVYEAGKRYRVRIFDDSASLVDEWYFIAYSSDFAGLPPINVAEINEKFSRLAGLLGLNQVIRHTRHEMGVPVETEIDLYDGDPLDPGSTQIGAYEQRKHLDLQGRVAAGVSRRVS
jgi:hypothetical protein